MQHGAWSANRSVPLLALILLLIAGAASEVLGQTQRSRARRPAQPAPIPGLPTEDRSPEDQQRLRERFQAPITERDRRRAAAGREGQALKRAYEANPQAEGAERTLFLAAARLLEAQRWQPAQAAFRELTETFPESLWAQEARLALFDLAFEADLDPDGAFGILEPAVDWAGTVEPGPIRGSFATRLISTPGPDEPLPLQPPGPPVETGSGSGELIPRPEHAIAADVHLRAGLLHWLADEMSPASQSFHAAFRLDPSPASPVRLIAHAVTRGGAYAHTPLAAIEGEEPQIGRLIRYADVIHNSLESYRAHRLWDGLLRKRLRHLSPAQRSYALFRRGQARFQFLNLLEKEPDRILADYEASRKAAPEAPWAAQTLLQAGDVAWNLKGDQPQAVAYWKALMDDYPETGHAERAAYLIGVSWERARDWERAFNAFEEAQRRYPDSSFMELIDKHLNAVARRLPQRREPATGLAPIPERKRSN